MCIAQSLTQTQKCRQFFIYTFLLGTYDVNNILQHVSCKTTKRSSN